MVKLLLIFYSIFLVGCDFTSDFQRSILSAENYIREGKQTEAIKVYENLLKDKPSTNIKVRIHFQLGLLYQIYSNDFTNSLKHFKLALKESPTILWQVKTIEKLGTLTFEYMKDFSLAEKYYSYLINFQPSLEKYHLYHRFYAKSLFHQSKFKLADEHFQKIIREGYSKESLAEAYYHKGLMNYEQKDWKEAITFWQESLKYETLKQSVVKIKFLMANAYESNEDLKEAYNLYYSLLNDFPDTQIIKNRLQNLYNRRVARKR